MLLTGALGLAATTMVVRVVRISAVRVGKDIHRGIFGASLGS